MRLFLHVGSEKSGSSYLQKLCGLNRDLLRSESIYFPHAGRDEERLLKGSISPGNARELSLKVGNGNWGGVREWLSTRTRAAEGSDCENILLSHELLFVALTKSGGVRKFESIAKQVGISSVHALLVVRDPVDQAVSLFKHRAKSGKLDGIRAWIETGYSLPNDLKSFLDQVSASSVKLTLRKYSIASETLVDMFFRDWLGMPSPPGVIEGRVNPSLTLSELEMIRQFAEARPAFVPLLYRNLLQVPLSEKARDDFLEATARAHAEDFLCRFNEFWEDLDRLLERDGGLNMPKPQADSQVPDSLYRYSDKQLRALTDSIDEFLSARFQLQLWVDGHVRRPLGRVRELAKSLLTGSGR